MCRGQGQLGELGPDVMPAAGEDAGARRVGGARESEQDAVEKVVREAAEVIRPAAPAATGDVALRVCAHGDLQVVLLVRAGGNPFDPLIF